MERYQGKAIVNGIVSGKIFAYIRDQFQVEKIHVEDAEKEVCRYRAAREETIEQYGEAYDKAVELVGAKNAAVFEMQSILLKEGKFCNLVEKMIMDEKVSASYAVAEVGRQLSAQYRMKEESWEKEEEINLRELGKRLLRVLEGRDYSMPSQTHPVIMFAKDILPGELLQLDMKCIQGLITDSGTGESHTAVLAAAMNLPYITGVTFKAAWNGREAVMDGTTGEVIIDPDEKEKEDMKERQKQLKEETKALEALTSRKTVTLDGVRVRLYANIGTLEEIDEVLRYKAEGIGLFRSEFLYMGRETYPSEEEQFECYRHLAERMQGKPVTIRTLDIGADKQMNYLRLDEEQNPAMGYRGIRISLEQQELFRTQLKAIYRAAVYGKLQVLYPMITSIEEVEQIQEIIEDIKEEMEAKKLPYGEVCQGVMIETPAAVMISDTLAQKVDFFSIGTNDLIQYIMAADRTNPKVSRLCNASHPAVLGMINMAVQNGHKHGIPVTICGEMAGELSMIGPMVEMGVDILSVIPKQILPVKQAVCKTILRTVR